MKKKQNLESIQNENENDKTIDGIENIEKVENKSIQFEYYNITGTTNNDESIVKKSFEDSFDEEIDIFQTGNKKRKKKIKRNKKKRYYLNKMMKKVKI